MPKQDYPIYAIRRYRLNLDEATAFHKVNFRGDFLWAIESSNKTVTANVRIGDVSADAVPIRYGTQFDGLQFNELWFEWAAQPGEWIDLVVAETNGRLEARNAVAYEVDVGGVVQTVPAVQNQAGTFLADQRYSVNVRANFVPKNVTRSSYTTHETHNQIGLDDNDIIGHEYIDGIHYIISANNLRAINRKAQSVLNIPIQLPAGWSNVTFWCMAWDRVSKQFFVGVRRSDNQINGMSAMSINGQLSAHDSRIPTGGTNDIIRAICFTDDYIILTRGGSNKILVYDRNGVLVSTITAPNISDFNQASIFVRDNILWARGGSNPVDAFDLTDFSHVGTASPAASITGYRAKYDPHTDLAWAVSPLTPNNFIGSAWGWSYTAPGYVTVERECASLRLAKPDRYIVRTDAEFSDGRIYGHVIRAALDAYFAPRIVGDNYLDHVYEVEFLGEGIKVSGGFTSLARANIADAFSVRYPVNARMIIDSNMPLSTISGA